MITILIIASLLLIGTGFYVGNKAKELHILILGIGMFLLGMFFLQSIVTYLI